MTAPTATVPATHATTTPATTILRRVLVLDALVTGGNGLIYLVASGPVAGLLGTGAGLLLGIGTFLTAYGLAVGVLAAQRKPSVSMTKLVIGANLLWALASIGVAAFGVLGTNVIGTTWTVLQAGTVAGFAALQMWGLRKLRTHH
ncbi:hypothetical protein SAMN04489729_3269 [Amycolatopsis lurida]|uniref:Integral membrane protein n=1 Tax=Amycolatopsis lurida NRRL 2430 TaxID=1460371 RepID=A0A2P2FJK5_AMYLU|nr:hypothetical protein [Amycolatopsis lurida]KFU76913.1 hypothetical protein BB31_33800 [Amycolatopsis lurida NRRL 2430]SED06902.1 hypothetical protein SAMN04489729_3269 [Amycolatopsis lurida]